MSIIISGGGGGGGATTLNGLSDVNITSVASGQIIAYNNTSGNWENQTGITGGLTYKGSFNATTGSPSLLNALQGDFYVVDTAGTIYGQTWNVGDHLLINEDMGGSITNSKIDKVDNTDQVTSVNGQTGAVTGLLEAGNNLSDLSAVPTARTNLGLGTAAVENVGTGASNVVQLDGSARLPAVDGSQLTNLPAAPVTSVNGQTGVVTGLLEAADNLSALANKATARTNLGLGTAAIENVGTGASNVVQLDGSARLPAVDGSQLTNLPAAPVTSVNGQTGVVTGLLEAADNLSALANKATARTNLGLGTAAIENVGTGASNVVQLDGSARLPAVDGSQLTNLPAAPVTSVNGQTGVVTGLLEAADNLSALANKATARTNLGLGTAAIENVGTGASNVVQLDGSARLPAVDGSQLTNLPAAPVTSVNGQTGVVTGLLEAANNLSDVANAGTSRTNLGLGTAAVENVGTGASNVVQLDGSSRLPAVDGSQLTNLPAAPVTSVNGQTGVVTGLLEASNNLSDVANAGTSRTNLGLGTAAVENVGTGANNVVQLDGSSRLPAVDGSQLTGLPGASRPTVTTDSSGTDSTISNPAASVLEDVYLVDNGAAAVNITLPTVTSNSGYKVQVKRLGTANVTLTPASGTIDGAANQVLSVQYAAFTCCTDGTNWFII